MTKKEKIKLLIVTTKSSAAIEEGFRALIDAMPNVIPGLEKVKKEFADKFDKLWEVGVEDMVTLYDQLISEEAIDAAVAFYSSAGGQELLAAAPKIDKGLMELGRRRTATLSKELIESLLALDLSEDQMEDLGFIKVAPEELEALQNYMATPEAEQPPKINIDVDPTEITESDLDNLGKWLDEQQPGDMNTSE